MKKKAAIGLSGGVDSSVAAALLLEQGYEVTGVYLSCWSGPGCRSEQDRQDALDVALQLGIPFEHLDFEQAYKDKVYEYMIREYEAGRTPNPDVMCNREIKFGLFYTWAMERGFDYVATGHYAQIKSLKSKVESINDSELRLCRSADEHKDQTYFLYQLKQEQLAHILFPIGHLTKNEVRAEAVKRNLLTATKPDSVGICFIGEQPMETFLKQRIQSIPGPIVLKGTKVGTHHGMQFYTIGQKIAIQQNKALQNLGFDPTNLPHFYVVNKNTEKNILYVGTEETLYRDTLEIESLHWIMKPVREEHLFIRIRHTGELIKIHRLVATSPHRLVATLDVPVRAAAAGQAAVLYEDKVCLGGGIIY